ncbi:MAG TPA: fatty acid desaturase CarF family protein [Candidatus Binatia bacterium]|nr:fatty acid desaturase CarF family protein [Candidatus Binatia bacterium]HKB38155.1 fatty acid desaturase CarF family protein [Gemmataceae bacterium]
MSEETARLTAEAFAVEPYTPSEIRFHVTGAVLNGACALAGLIWVAATWKDHPPSWPWLLLAVLTGIYTADLVSGLLHWAFDTWFDENVTFLRRMVRRLGAQHGVTARGPRSSSGGLGRRGGGAGGEKRLVE